MGGFFYAGETKERPDNYHRYTNTGGKPVVRAESGVVAIVAASNWGPLNKVMPIEPTDDISKFVGDGKVKTIIQKAFQGGATLVKVVRIGSGGTQGTCKLKDTTPSTALDVITLTAKYAGTRTLSVSVKESLSDSTIKELAIFEGNKKLESYNITAGENEVSQAVALLAKSAYVVAKEEKAGTGVLAACTQTPLSGGTDPVVNNGSYSEGFTAAEPETWNVIVVDTDSTEVHTLLHAYIDRIYETGSYPMAVVCEKSSVELDTRMTHATSFNDEKMIYVLNGWETADGTVIEGESAAAQIAGMVASISANDSLTHKAIAGAAKIHETLTNTQIIAALKKGCFVISTSRSSGQVRVEKGINTLVQPAGNQDAGWKKIRRVKTRFELMNRIDMTIDELNGSINNDADGRSSIVAAGQAVIDAMIGEKKLLAGAEIIEDPNNPPMGDSAWFLVSADDIDSFEIGYFTYGFRFSQPADE